MRFLLDECTGPVVARWLCDQQHEVFSVYEEARGMEDDEIIQKAFTENWVLITNDKDFGEKIYRERYPHRGVVLLRLTNDRAGNKVDAIRRLLQDYANELVDCYVVVTETKVRFARK
jgi:predicted nuclease of predicted toxin-antitoxin system